MPDPFVPVFHQLLDPAHDMNAGEPACRFRAWVDILSNVRPFPRTWMIEGRPVVIAAGETIPLSVRMLARRWSWSRGKTARFLDYLQRPDVEKLGHPRGTPLGTIYRVVTYGTYREALRAAWDTPMGHPPGHPCGTPESDDGGTPPWDTPDDAYLPWDEGDAAAAGDDVGHPRGTPENRNGGTPSRDKTKTPAPSLGPDAGDVENPGRRPLDDVDGIRPEALEAARSLRGFTPLTERGIIGTFGANGTLAHLWRGVDDDRRPDLLSAALVRAAEIKSGEWHGRFFESCLRGVIEAELLPTPADQAKARAASSPAGRLTAEAERVREARQRDRAARRGRVEPTHLSERRDRDRAEEEAARAWLDTQPDTVRDGLRSEAEQWARANLPIAGGPPRAFVESFILRRAFDLSQRTEGGEHERE